jgi:hypothetical protein
MEVKKLEMIHQSKDRLREDRDRFKILSDLYQQFLNSKVEAVLANGKTIQGMLTGISKYAIMIEEFSGLTIINKAFLVEVKQVKI